MRKVLSLLAAACAALTTVSAPAKADTYPSKPIRFIVGYAPGGAVDIVTRIIGEKLSARLGQQIVVENRPGGGTIIAMTALHSAAPDGYTMMMADIAMGANPSLNNKLPYDTFKDFDPVGLVAVLPGVMAVSPKLDVKNVKEFVELAKSRPGKMNYATSGMGSLGHLGAELFVSETKTNIVAIPYQGGGQVTQALVGGNVEMFFATVPPVLPVIDKVKVLAISHNKRLDILPNVPTFAESGLPGVDVQLWQGVFVPHGTDRKIVDRVNKEINEILKDPAVRERIAKLGGDVAGGTPEQLGTFLKAEVAKWSKTLEGRVTKH